VLVPVLVAIAATRAVWRACSSSLVVLRGMGRARGVRRRSMSIASYVQEGC
jgi:hypothetical protein